MELKKHQELRFETKGSIKIIVESGVCEHKGEELLNDTAYTFQNTKSFIFAHADSKIRIEGESENYISSNTSTLGIIDFYNKMDEKSYIVLGKGKSTFIQTISNYIIRSFKRVLITELNPSTSFFFPGCLSTDLRYLDNSSPLVYFYGSTKIKNLDYYLSLLHTIDNVISKKEFDYHFILAEESIMHHLKDTNNLKGKIVVCKEEKLFNKINNGIFIDGGVYETLDKINFDFYFYGKSNEYTSFNLNLRNVKVVRIGEEYFAPDYALPIGEERKIKSDAIVEVECKYGSILAVSYANNIEEVKNVPIKGFVKVIGVEESFIKVMAAQPNLKCSFLVQGDF